MSVHQILHQKGGRVTLTDPDWLTWSVIETRSVAQCFSFQCVRVLLRYGCDPELKDNNGLTAADLAENCWHRECAATLRRRLTKVTSTKHMYCNVFILIIIIHWLTCPKGVH